MEFMLSILMDISFAGILVWCSYMDTKMRLVSNISVVLLLFLAFAHMAFAIQEGWSWLQYPAGLLVSIPFFIAWLKNLMGAGDIKLIAAIALYLGLYNMIISFLLMIPLLAVFMVYTWIKNKTFTCRIPFAPVLAFGSICVVLLGNLNTLGPL